MIFGLFFLALVLLIPLVLWTWVYVSAFKLAWKQRRERKDPQQQELEKLAGELDEARAKLLVGDRPGGNGR
jgi:hypothetical protein